MKKRGFTLSEVLVTLSVIGVISALTVPNLVQKSNNTINAQALSSNISNLENAFSTMLAEEDVNSLFKTQAWGLVNLAPAGQAQMGIDVNNFVGNLSRYLKNNGQKTEVQITEMYEDSLPMTFLNGNGGADADVINSVGIGHVYVLMKTGAIAFIHPQASNPRNRQDVINAGGSLFDVAARVLIDVNGIKAPNRIGRDIFAFYLGDDAVLHPLGGFNVAVYLGDIDNVWTAEDAAKSFTCLDRNFAMTPGYGCTARVIEEGFQINY